MDVLAKEAGVARATVYEHFRSKRAVLDELASSIAGTVTMDESQSATADPLVALRDLLGAVCRHWAEHEERMNGLRTLTALTGGDQARRRHRREASCADSSRRWPRPARCARTGPSTKRPTRSAR